jgi:uncharacterized protein (DUF362 family)
MENKVYISQSENIAYSMEKPFHPSRFYPEYPFGNGYISESDNCIYDEVRILLNAMGMDSFNFGKSRWNPFCSFIKPGDNVLIKPTMVNHFHPLGLTMDCLITNGSLIRAIMDFVIIALNGQGKISIGDAPIQSAIFERIVQTNGVDKIIEFYKSQIYTIQFEIIDFRQTIAICNEKGHIKKTLTQENCEFKYVDLDEISYFSNVINRKFAIADYPFSAMKEYHSNGKNRYMIPQTLLDSNVIINLPKPKTHRFAGITGAMKNFIGVNSQKENLPHYSIGNINENGDEYPSKSSIKKFISFLTNQITILAVKGLYLLSLPLYFVRHILIRMVNTEDMVFKGSWHGNDTIWRTILDVNRIVLYADKRGNINKTQQRTVFTICDSIITGEYQGPLQPDPKKSNALIAGFNLYVIDRFLAKFMGFNSKYLPFIQNCPKDLGKIPDEEILIFSKSDEWESSKLYNYKSVFSFKPASGWEIISK